MDSLRYTVLPEKFNWITLQTNSPGARIIQHHETLKEPVVLYADADGVVHLHVYPPSVSPDSCIRLTLEGADSSVCLELRACAEETQDYPFHKPVGRSVRNGTVRPALTDEEVTTLSNEELVRRGYSPRPILKDGTISASWLKAVKSPSTRVEPLISPRKSQRCKKTLSSASDPSAIKVTDAPAIPVVTSPNWCGIEVRNRSGYDFITGTWVQPTLTFQSQGTGWGQMATWVGFDGDGLVDLPQAGTNVEAFSYGPGPQWFQAYPYSWTEFLPSQTSGIAAGVPLQQGDEMQVVVWLDALGPAGSPAIPFGYAHMEINNLTSNIHTVTTDPIGTTAVSSTEAEWIVEAPAQAADNGVGTVQLPLYQYPPFILFDAFVERKGSGGVVERWNDEGQNARFLFMQRGANPLSDVIPLPDANMQFFWLGNL